MKVKTFHYKSFSVQVGDLEDDGPLFLTIYYIPYRGAQRNMAMIPISSMDDVFPLREMTDFLLEELPLKYPDRIPESRDKPPEPYNTSAAAQMVNGPVANKEEVLSGIIDQERANLEKDAPLDLREFIKFGIDQLGLKPGTHRALDNADFVLVQDIVGLTREELLRVPRIGPKKADEICEALRKHGLHLESD